MTTRDETEARRRWANDQIASLKLQRRGIDEAINRYEDFVALLVQSSAALRDAADDRDKAAAPKKLKANSPLVDYLRAALADCGQTGLPVPDVIERVIDLGYKPGGKSKTSPKTAIRSELARRSKLTGSGIVRVDRGRYAAAGQPRQLDLVDQ